MDLRFVSAANPGRGGGVTTSETILTDHLDPLPVATETVTTQRRLSSWRRDATVSNALLPCIVAV